MSSQRRRLDGFYARCLRKVLGVPVALVSRVSNQAVCDKAKVRPLSQQVLFRQLLYFGRVALAPDGHPIRRDVFVDGSLHFQLDRYVKRVGRPRQTWASELRKEADRLLGSQVVERLLNDRTLGADLRWRAEVEKYFPRL